MYYSAIPSISSDFPPILIEIKAIMCFKDDTYIKYPLVEIIFYL